MADRYIGLMSGTSADGIDAVLMEFEPAPRILATHYSTYPDSVKERVRRIMLGQHPGDPLDEAGALDSELGELFGAAVLALLEHSKTDAGSIRAVGSHGQTIRHRPRQAHPFTTQIADPNIIAARTGITVVADFRRRDVALGGQGAPLLPAFHKVAFGSATEDRVVLNTGGIANITLLPAQGEVRGFDTGPANVLMDMVSRDELKQPFDEGGKVAASGTVDAALLASLLQEPYFDLPAPKSTGPELFNRQWLDKHLAGRRLATQDLMATLAELTARTVAEAALQNSNGVKRVYVCGGGANNAHLLARLSAQLPGATVESTAAIGIDPAWVEAAGFAWLAYRTVNHLPGNLPAVTGAGKYAVLGAIYPA
ncbi:MAG TPA: anhydro-N-acetylmuramic acid kinase [Gammaproteobacteria bacterium]|nr:anhydro-N-acetylmuramic acid kinase [Gammaproteobacteria bacterium]